MNPEIEKLEKSIGRARAKVNKLQAVCPHENVDAKYNSNTGNYDPTADCYWVEVKCLDCGKYMSFDSERERAEYHHYGSKVIRK